MCVRRVGGGGAAYHALDLGERERGGRLPVRRRAQDQVVERVADPVVLAVEGVCGKDEDSFRKKAARGAAGLEATKRTRKVV